MKITVFVPRDKNKWEISWGKGGQRFKKINYATARKYVESKIKQYLASELRGKIHLIVDYGQFYIPSSKTEWINESISIDAQKALLDLDYFTEDYR